MRTPNIATRSSFDPQYDDILMFGTVDSGSSISNAVMLAVTDQQRDSPTPPTFFLALNHHCDHLSH